MVSFGTVVYWLFGCTSQMEPKYSLNKSRFTDVYSCNILRDWIHKNMSLSLGLISKLCLKRRKYSALMNLPLPMKENNLLSVLSYMSKATYRASKMVNLKENVLTWRNRRVVSEMQSFFWQLLWTTRFSPCVCCISLYFLLVYAVEKGSMRVAFNVNTSLSWLASLWLC